MIANTVYYLPRSCLEVKNGSPQSPSGYYTVMNDNSGVATIVYCNMDDLNSCFDLEQSLTGIMSSVGTLTGVVSGLHSSHETLSASVSGVQAGVDSLQTGLKANYEALNASVSGVQANIDGLQADFDTFQVSDGVTSCEDIKSKWPWATSGWYKILSEDVYCYMGNRCGMVGPWRRVLYLDMTDPTQTCPDGLRLYRNNGTRACGRPQSFSGCTSLPHPCLTQRYVGKLLDFSLVNQMLLGVKR